MLKWKCDQDAVGYRRERALNLDGGESLAEGLKFLFGALENCQEEKKRRMNLFVSCGADPVIT